MKGESCLEWKELDITTTSEAADIICARLMDIGINGFAIQDSEDFKELLSKSNTQWDYIEDSLMQLNNSPTKITVYLPKNEQGYSQLKQLKELLLELKQNDESIWYGTLELTDRDIKESDWADNWKQFFKPLPIGEKILIKPTWEECDEKTTQGRVVLEIDPESSFGTGQHHTTKLCLELLEQVLQKGDRLLDIGCGSGILSIAGLLLDAESAIGVDIEQHSVETSEKNAVINGYTTDKFKAYCGNLIADEDLLNSIGVGYDIITSNIVADVIIAMSNIYKKLLKSGGMLLVSGIIIERAEEVTSALVKNGFAIVKNIEENGWAAVQLIKNGD